MLGCLLSFLLLVLVSPFCGADLPVNGPINFLPLLNSLSAATRSSALLPGVSGFDSATLRWNTYSLPASVSLVLTPATPDEISKILWFATTHKIPVLPITSTHGFAVSIRSLQNTILLNMRPHFTGIKRVGPNTLEIGGGVVNHEVVDYLHANNLRTATGGCDCVGITSLALGGGLGKYAGEFGLVSDVVEGFNIVTPRKGSILRADSTHEPELFWGMRGAGHNLAVVTSSLIHVRPKGNENPDGWINAQFFYTEDKIEEVVTWLESWRKTTQRKEMTVFMGFFPPFAPGDAPSLRLSVQYFGPRDDAAWQPFWNFGPFYADNATVAWNGIATATFIGKDMGACLYTSTRRAHHAALLRGIRPENVRQAHALYTQLQATPFANSSFVWEVYPWQGVLAVPDADTAYPWRKDAIVSLLMVNYEGEENDGEAVRWGRLGRDILKTGESGGDAGLKVYVNYAHGDEGETVWYGDQRRRNRIRALKKKWDPKGVLRGYDPVAV